MQNLALLPLGGELGQKSIRRRSAWIIAGFLGEQEFSRLEDGIMALARFSIMSN